MDREHPIVTLTVGTLRANVKRASGGQDNVAEEALSTVQEIVRIAWGVKRKAQALIGRFVQQVSAGPHSSMDIELLHAICPPMAGPDDNEDDENDGEVANLSTKYNASKSHQE